MFGNHPITRTFESVYDRIGFNLTIAITKAKFVGGICSVPMKFATTISACCANYDLILSFIKKSGLVAALCDYGFGMRRS